MIPRTPIRIAVLGALGVLVLVAVGVVLWLVAKPLPGLLQPPREPLLPDLATELAEIRGATGVQSGRDFLYFTTTIGNIGDGPLEIRADRRNRWTSTWRVTQRFDEKDGAQSESVFPGNLVWGGHGHDHWHLKFGAEYWLEARGSNRVQRRLAKAGYCFFDQVARTSAATASVYGKDTCDGVDRTSIVMGMSTGWSDPYQWTLPDQKLDITGLPSGTYRLFATADPDGWLRETNEGNNVDWVDIEIDTASTPIRASVVGRAPRSLPPPPPG